MKKIVLYLLFLTIPCFACHVMAQEVFSAIKEQSYVKVKGTSSLHDWEMSMHQFSCSLIIQREESAITIKSASFSGESGSLESGNSIMNKKTHDALKSKEFPFMNFILKNGYKVESVDSTFGGKVEGTLELAGIAKQIKLEFKGRRISENKIEISGSKTLKMTDFKITPPTAMFGTLKTGDEITVVFVIILKST